MYRVTAPRYTTSRTCPVAVQSSPADRRVRLGERDLLGPDRERVRIAGDRLRRRRPPARSRPRRTRPRTRSTGARTPRPGVPTCSIVPVVEHRQAVAHRERLLLVVRDVDERQPDRPAGSPSARSASAWRSLRSSAPSGSSSSSTLGRMTSARASATRWRWPPESCAGLAVPELAEAHHVERLVRRAPRRSAFGDLADHQPVGDVLGHRHVREQRVVLEHRVDVALVRRPAARRRCRRAGSGPPWAARTRRSCAGTWSCPSPTDPSIEKNSPSRTSRSTPSTAVTSPKRLTTSSSRTATPSHGRSAVGHRHGSIGQAVFPLMLVGAPNPERSQS